MSKGRTAAIHEESTSPAIRAAVVERESGRQISGVQVVATPSRPPEVGSATLKQNAALLDRLREVAMRSDPPAELEAALRSVIPPNEEEVTTQTIRKVAVPAPPRISAIPPSIKVVPDVALATTSRAFPLVSPARRDLAEGAAPIGARLPVAASEEEPQTKMGSGKRRTLDRARRRRVIGVAAIALAVIAAGVGVGLSESGSGPAPHARASSTTRSR